MKKTAFFAKAAVALILASSLFFGCTKKTEVTQDNESVPKIERGESFKDEYTLSKVVVLSRHNIRSPLSDGSSMLAKVTPHEWFNWPSRASELSLRGGVLETIMGQYFRKWLESENLIPENYIPKDGEVRFYANSMQRTIATAQYFSSGMLPVANVVIEHRYAPSKMDAVFTPQTVHLYEGFEAAAMEQINSLYGKASLAELCETLKPAYEVLEKVLDFEKSEYAQANGFPHFKTDDTEVFFKEMAEPSMKGSLKLATSASDALVLQYYEESDDKKAAFGHDISRADWEKIASIKDMYGDVLFTAPVVAKEVARPLLKEIAKELGAAERKFTFLCGHDSNVASVLAALDVKDYSLPAAIEKKTPIGVKLVFEVWKDKNDAEFVALNLVYQTTEQLRSCQMLSLQEPPAKYEVFLNGLEQNESGLYQMNEVLGRFEEAEKQ